jgi:DNA-binding transcriptional MerR regulator
LSRITSPAVVSVATELRIGDLARASGLSPDSLRHYERLGLLRPAARTSGGFRKYPADAVRRVKVIQRSLAIGFTLADLASIFRERAAGLAPCRRVRALADEKLRALNDRIVNLQRLRDALGQTLVAWDGRLAVATAGRPAGLLDALADLPEDPDRAPNDRGPPRRVRAR